MATQNNKPKVEKQLKYRELISRSEKDLLEEELDLKVQEPKSQLEIDIATKRRDLSLAKRKLADAQARVPYDVQLEIDAAKNVKALEECIAFAEAVLAERY